MKQLLLLAFMLVSLGTWAQEQKPEAPKWQGKFEQLDQTLPTPNEYRSGSGAPGPKYWQQQADYDMAIELNDLNQSISGKETITYINNSPDVLRYLWLQLDQNILDKESNTAKTQTSSIRDSTAAKSMAGQFNLYDYEGGYKVKAVTDVNGKALSYTINKTMMRVDLPTPLKSYKLN